MRHRESWPDVNVALLCISSTPEHNLDGRENGLRVIWKNSGKQQTEFESTFTVDVDRDQHHCANCLIFTTPDTLAHFIFDRAFHVPDQRDTVN
ncbi:hypothetical protein T05_9051 [Trichinella murrelli]|uniref:Uncharacterized protein n=1 Tax=Trichinella murrelli TaxID=144512 RepID=A0A0V0UEX5_9BILA|nr:hypothetical protein T05_9051 [Trichinella murrelli]